MEKIVIYAETPALASVMAGFAAANGAACTALAFSEQQAAAIAGCGASDIALVQGASERPEDYAKALAALFAAEGTQLFLVGSTATGRELAAKVAGYANCTMVSDATKLECAGEAIRATRMVYGGIVVQTETLNGFAVVTAGGGLCDAAPAGSAACAPLALEADTRIQVVSTDALVKEGVDLGSAERVVCVGNGVANKEDLAMVQQLADALNADIGCSRGVAEERKWLPVEAYIGISGAILNSNLYLSLGVSGSVQHTYGIRGSKIVAAIDKNKDALIFGEADYGLVGDLYEIVPELIKAFA